MVLLSLLFLELVNIVCFSILIYNQRNIFLNLLLTIVLFIQFWDFVYLFAFFYEF